MTDNFNDVKSLNNRITLKHADSELTLYRTITMITQPT